MEIWKDIDGYSGRYQVSNLGRIKSVNPRGKDGEIIFSTCCNQAGYRVVNLRTDGKPKTFLVHRLVASAFLPNPHNFKIVNHINENREDNRVENLEWCDSKYNSQYSYRLHENVRRRGKRVLCVETGIEYPSIGYAAFVTGAHFQNISRACRESTRTAGSFHWRLI